ncbi:hypothetical protein F4775DRAFT_604898 [Biscogniauxia sp. FL1348]|nr:hypothetical protein F4775DRAFT_604898 [Biscogniauxia sp. FL1348]
MACPQSTSTDGIERHFAINYLAHFSLTALLRTHTSFSTTTDSSTSFYSCIIYLSFPAHRWCPGGADIPSTTAPRSYDPLLAYGHSKLAVIWASNSIDRICGRGGVHSLALNPGAVWLDSLLCYVTLEQREWRSDQTVMRHM